MKIYSVYTPYGGKPELRSLEVEEKPNSFVAKKRGGGAFNYGKVFKVGDYSTTPEEAIQRKLDSIDNQLISHENAIERLRVEYGEVAQLKSLDAKEGK